MQLKNVIVACSMSLICIAPALAVNADPAAIAQAPPQFNGAAPQYHTGVAMTLYRLLSAGNGAQYYLNAYGQAVPLPGAGVSDKENVAVYTGNGGESWYIDRNGSQVDLPEVETPPEPPETSPYWNAQSQQTPQQQASQNPAGNVEVINNVPPQNNSGNGGSSAGTTALAAGVGGLLGSFGGAALDMAVGGIPYGVPVYAGWGGGAPYYYGPNGNRTYINNSHTNINNNHFNEWNNQQNWYRNQVNNDNGRYNHNWWPGKEHGFPRPGQQVPGRMYSPENSGAWNHGEFDRANGGEFRREGAFHPEGGERRFGGGGEVHRFGGGGHMFGGGHMGAMHFGRR